MIRWAASLGVAVTLLAGCGSSFHRTIETGADGLRTFTWQTAEGGHPMLCTAAAAIDPVVGVLRGFLGARDPVWLVERGGARLSVIWPAGFAVRFEPDAALYDENGVRVATDGQEVELGQVSRSQHSGSYDDPFVASGILFDGCHL